MAEAPISKKRKRGNPNQTTGLIGVYKSGEKYHAQITYGGKTKSLGTFDTKEKAGIAYDRFVVDKSNEELTYVLNYPNMSEQERKKAIQKKHGSINPRTGLIGVYLENNTDKFRSEITIAGQHHIGTFDTKVQAAMAYDQFVIDKSTEERSFTLNYPKRR